MRVINSSDVVDGVTKITEEESVRIHGKRRPFNDFKSHLNEFCRPRNEEVRNKTECILGSKESLKLRCVDSGRRSRMVSLYRGSSFGQRP